MSERREAGIPPSSERGLSGPAAQPPRAGSDERASGGGYPAEQRAGPERPGGAAAESGKHERASRGGYPAEQRAGPSGPAAQPPRAESMSERREPGIPASSERGRSGPAAQPPRAESMSAAGPTAWLYATNWGSHDVSVYAVEPDGTLRTAPALVPGPRGATNPLAAVLDARGRSLFVSNWGSGDLSRFERTRDGLVADRTVEPGAPQPVNPAGLARTSDGRFLFMAGFNGGDRAPSRRSGSVPTAPPPAHRRDRRYPRRRVVGYRARARRPDAVRREHDVERRLGLSRHLERRTRLAPERVLQVTARSSRRRRLMVVGSSSPTRSGTP